MAKNRIKIAGIIAGIILTLTLFGFLFVKVARIGIEYITVSYKIESYLAEGKYEEAVRYIDSFLTPDNRRFYLLSNKGYALIQLGKDEEAFGVLTEALKIKPGSDVVLNNLSWASYNLGRYTEALDYSNRALEIMPGDEATLVNKGNALLELERHEEALEAYNAAIAANPEYDVAYYGRGITYYEIDKYKEAIQDFVKYTELVPDDMDGYYYLGESYLYDESYDLAIGTIAGIIEKEPDSEYAYLLKGQALDGARRYDEALKSYDKAIELDSQYTDAYMNKGISYYEQEKYKDAIDYLDKAIAIEPEYTTPYVWKAKAFIGVKDYSRAVDICNKAISIDPSDSFAYNILSRAYYMMEDYTAALDAANLAINSSVNYEDAYIAKADILDKQSDFIDNLAFLDNALKLFPDSKDLLWYKADMLSYTFKHDEAVKLYEKVLEFDKNDSDVLLDIAWEYYYNQDYGKSGEYLNRVEKSDYYADEVRLLEDVLKEASLPESKRIANFVRENYLYISNVGDFEKKARGFEAKEELEIADIKAFLNSIIVDKDRFSFLVFGREYDEMNREETDLHIVEKVIKADINYVGIPVFTEQMGSEFVRAVDKIYKPEGKILIIDLRDNPGGSINAANEMLDHLLGSTVTTSLVYRSGKAQNYNSDKNQVKFKKIIIMVNENSASSSEILTLGLKKYLNNVTVIGHPTFGKGVGQMSFDNKAKRYSIFLTSFYWNVKNQNITGSRITPDLIVKGSKDSDYFDTFNKYIKN